MIASISIKPGEYTEGQQGLINMWNRHLGQVAKGSPDIGLIFTLPRTKRGIRKRFEGFKVHHLSLTPDLREVVRMETGDFILLMAKSGIHISVEEVQHEETRP